ncbi:cell division protein FtsA [bacterium]
MGKHDLIAALELGSGKVSCAIAKKDKIEGFKVLGIAEVLTNGLQNASVVSIEETVKAIQECVEKVEDMTGERVDSLFVGIKGRHIETYNHNGAINITRSDKEISEEDKMLVLEAGRQMQLSNDREIIETIPLGYVVDKQTGVPDPIGMEGAHLGVAVHLVTASTTALNNIYKCINKAGFKVNELTYNMISLGDSVVTPEEKELGVVLVDIGGQVIDIAFYIMGGLYHTTEIPIGGDYITRDIAYAMRTSFKNSRQLKEEYGYANPAFVDEDKELQYLGVDGISEQKTTISYLSEIIAPRIEEIMQMLKKEIAMSEFSHMVPAGLVITGGTSAIKGIVDVAEKVTAVPVRLGPPQGINASKQLILNPSFSSVLSLLKYAERSGKENKKRLKKKSVFASFKKKLEEIF